MDLKTALDTLDYVPAMESDAAAQAWLNAHGRKFGLFINGDMVGLDNDTLAVHCPADGQHLADVAIGTPADVAAAYKSARAAHASWSQLSDHKRAQYLYAIARNIQKHDRLFAVLEALDNGKSIRETRDIDVPLVARHFYHHAGWAQLMSQTMSGYKALGVVGQVIPWNFPLLMLAWKIAPALAMGNTVVIKPAPATPLTALLFAEICQSVDLPKGVVNIVPGDDETGKAITGHPGFDKLAFTGSTEVGKIIRRATAGRDVKLSLELGGKSPFIVFADADQDAAIEGLVDAIWFNQGEVCCAGSRLLVQESIATEFFAKLKRRMDTLRVGHPLDKTIDMGAVVDDAQYQQIDSWVQLGISEGAECYKANCVIPTGGAYYPPTLLTGLDQASSVVTEEIFGPVLVGMTFRMKSEAVSLANNTRYGLAASIWSENINVALEVATQVRAGSIWINCTNQFDAAAGFGGYYESGFGREGGKEGLYEYVHPADSARADLNQLPERDLNWGKHTPAFPIPTNGTNDAVDRTSKLYIGGKQARPDGHYSYAVTSPKGNFVGYASDGNRKDIRNAVAAAHSAKGWADRTPHNRAQILYYIAENMSIRAAEFADRIRAQTGKSRKAADAEVETSISRLFSYAAWADKYGGTVQETPLYGLVVGMTDPVGVIGIACSDDMPLLGFVSLVGPAIARGNTVVAIPSPNAPLCATDLYQIFETSDLPGGVVNIVTGNRDHLSKTLVEHDDVDAMWYFGDALGSREIEFRSADNMKRTWVSNGKNIDWLSTESEGEVFLRQATQVKNVWAPMGI